MNLLITNIKELLGIESQPSKWKAGAEMKNIGRISSAYLCILDGKIASFGAMEDMPQDLLESNDVIDAAGRLVLPGFADSHTHLVFAATREGEFVDRIKGLSYEEIAEKGGGILNSANRLQQMSEDDLYSSALQRLKRVIAMGTTAIEIKSGYGLTVEDELKILRVVKRLKAVAPITVKATFLGAHAIPTIYKNDRETYMSLVIDEMLPKVMEEGLADYCDVFCDRGFFTVEETARIMKAAAKHGLRSKIHANELGHTGGVQVGVANQALSVDHLEHCGKEEIEALKGSDTIPVLLPGVSFFLRLPYGPGRQIIDAGLPLCLATDYNPGSSPMGRMSFLLSLGCTQMGLLPEEALNAITVNGAYALELQESHGSICVGKEGNVLITNPVSSFDFLPYHFAEDSIDQVILKGVPYKGDF